MVDFAYATPADAAKLARNLRLADADELQATYGHGDHERSILEALSVTPEAFVALDDEGDPLCIYGVAPIGGLLTAVGAPWLLGSNGLYSHARNLMSETRHYIGHMRKEFPMMVNFVDARNKASARFIASMGFQIDPAEPYGAEQRPFHRFHSGF